MNPCLLSGNLRSRCAFTLVELLVVIAIIGILAGLLLPAIQSVREGARRTVCLNNSRQMGIALQNHLATHGHFPVGGIETHFKIPAPRKQIAWNVALLPFLEQPAVYDLFDYDFAYDSVANLPATSQVIRTFVCPTASRAEHTTGDRNGNGQQDPGDNMGITDYGGMHGLSKPPFLSFSQLVPPWVHSPQFRGGMSYEIALKASHFRDGLSNTVMVGECVRNNQFESQWANGQNLFDQHYLNSINLTNNNEIFSEHPAGATMLFGDGHAGLYSETLSLEVLNAVLTRAGGETEGVDL